MITEREKFLMEQAMIAGEFYNTVDDWLADIIDDYGHTVENQLAENAEESFGKPK